MSGLDALYQELILDHSKRRAGFGLADEGTGNSATSHQRNPVCGDEITLRVRVKDDVVLDVTWEGAGCAISQASASMLAALVEEDGGMPRAQASASSTASAARCARAERFRSMRRRSRMLRP